MATGAGAERGRARSAGAGEGHVKVRNGPRNAKLHYLEIPFNE